MLAFGFALALIHRPASLQSQHCLLSTAGLICFLDLSLSRTLLMEALLAFPETAVLLRVPKPWDSPNLAVWKRWLLFPGRKRGKQNKLVCFGCASDTTGKKVVFQENHKSHICNPTSSLL